MNVFQNELSSFEAPKEIMGLSLEAQAAILTLIEPDYTSSQVSAAYVASGVLGIFVDELAEIRAAEIQAEKAKKRSLQATLFYWIPHVKLCMKVIPYLRLRKTKRM